MDGEQVGVVSSEADARDTSAVVEAVEEQLCRVFEIGQEFSRSCVRVIGVTGVRACFLERTADQMEV